MQHKSTQSRHSFPQLSTILIELNTLPKLQEVMSQWDAVVLWFLWAGNKSYSNYIICFLTCTTMKI